VIVKGEAEFAQEEYVSGDFFHALAVMPAAGRLIAADDDRPGADPVAVLSLGYSQRRFGDAAGAVGQAIVINNAPFTVIGVAPAELFVSIQRRRRMSISPCAPPGSSSSKTRLTPLGLTVYPNKRIVWSNVDPNVR
jgi:hypothetical protein